MKHPILRTILCVLSVLGIAEMVSAQAVPSQAFTNVTLHFADGSSVSKATILWRNGSIEAAGTNVSIPFDAKVIDGGDSLHIYPGWIDGLAEWAMPEIPRERVAAPDPGNPSYERAGIQPHRLPHQMLVANSRDFTDWRKLGFTAAAVAPRGFMLPGNMDLMSINGTDANDQARLLIQGIGMRASMQPSPGVNPSTTMGVMARYRQLLFDAQALRVNARLFASNTNAYSAPEPDPVLESLWPVLDGKQTVFFSADNPEDIRRALKLKDEFGLKMVLVSGRNSWMMASELAQKNVAVLASLNFPAKPSFMSQTAKDSVDKRTAEHIAHNQRQEEAWKAEVANIKKLMDSGVMVGFSGVGLRSADFSARVKDLKDAGLSDLNILQLFSSNTAKIIGHGNLLGDLKKGMIAGFGVYTHPISDSKSKLNYSVAFGDVKYYPVPASTSNARGATTRGQSLEGDK
jgi:hypothetical protein